MSSCKICIEIFNLYLLMLNLAVSLQTRCMDAKLGATKERIHMTTPWWWGTRSNHHKIESHQDEDAADIRDGPPGKMYSRGPTHKLAQGANSDGTNKMPMIHPSGNQPLDFLAFQEATASSRLWTSMVFKKRLVVSLITGLLNAMFVNFKILASGSWASFSA